MVKRVVAFLFLAAVVLLTAGACVQAEKEQYMDVNGITLAYVEKGEGQPLLLLHGGGGSCHDFDHVIDRLSKNYTVYALDSRGQGKSSFNGELNYQDMAEDVIQFIEKKNLQKPALYGFSDGGIIGLLVASQHPDLLSKMIVSGANTTPDGMKEEERKVMEVMYEKTGDRLLKMELTQPHITASELKEIGIPVLILAGSDDMIKEEHTRSIAEGIPQSQLKILQGETHTSYVLGDDQIADLIEGFLEE